MLCALMLAPATAAEWYEGKPDCPPDMFCTESIEDPTGYNESHMPVEPVQEDKGEKASGFVAVIGLAALALVALRR